MFWAIGRVRAGNQRLLVCQIPVQAKSSLLAQQRSGNRRLCAEAELSSPRVCTLLRGLNQGPGSVCVPCSPSSACSLSRACATLTQLSLCSLGVQSPKTFFLFYAPSRISAIPLRLVPIPLTTLWLKCLFYLLQPFG